MDRRDVLIVGAGPAGLAAACECQDQGLSHVVVDRRGLAHSFVEYPQTLRFFSPPDEMAIDDVPFPMRGGDKPTREDALAYYRAVAHARKVDLATWEDLSVVEPLPKGFRVVTRHVPIGEPVVERHARAIVLAAGVWEHPRRLQCSGADMPHVLTRFVEPTEYLGHDVLVVGGGNSAVTAALSLAEAHARVTLAMRRPPVPYQNHLRPFIVRDLEFAVDEGKVRLCTGVVVDCIEAERVWLQPAVYHAHKCLPHGDPYAVPARFVFALLGHTADPTLMHVLGLGIGPDGRPPSDPTTHETVIPGVFVAGSLTSPEVDIIIKGREQAREVVRTIAARLRPAAR